MLMLEPWTCFTRAIHTTTLCIFCCLIRPWLHRHKLTNKADHNVSLQYPQIDKIDMEYPLPPTITCNENMKSLVWLQSTPAKLMFRSKSWWTQLTAHIWEDDNWNLVDGKETCDQWHMRQNIHLNLLWIQGSSMSRICTEGSSDDEAGTLCFPQCQLDHEK